MSYLGANGDLNAYNLYAYCSNNPVMYSDPSGHSIVVSILACSLIGAAIGGFYGGFTAAANEQNIGWGVGIGVVSGGLMGAGATIASLYLAPVLIGQTVVVGGATIGTAGALTIGSGIAFGTGFICGMASDAIGQLVNKGKIDNVTSIFESGIQWGIINTSSTLLGSIAGPTTVLEGNLLSAIFGSVTSAIGFFVDVVRNLMTEA